MYKQKGFNAGEGTGSSNPLKREIGGVEVRDSQYRGVKGNAKQRKLKRAKKGYNKARARLEEGKELSTRQRRLMEEHQYNLDRQAEIKAGRESKKTAREARKSESLKPGARTDANANTKEQQAVLDEYGFDPKGTPKDMPAVDVSPRPNKPKSQYSKIENPEASKRAGHKVYYSNQEMKDLRSKGLKGDYDEMGVKSYYDRDKKTGDWSMKYAGQKGSFKNRNKALEDVWASGTYGKDAQFPVKEDGSKDHMAAYKIWRENEDMKNSGNYMSEEKSKKPKRKPGTSSSTSKRVSNEEGLRMIEEAKKKQKKKPMTDDEYYAEARRLGTFDINHGRAHEK